METKIYTSQNRIIQIEPYQGNNENTIWLSDKGRQFFDGIFEQNVRKTTKLDQVNFNSKTWKKTFQYLINNIYIFDYLNHLRNKTKNSHFMTIVFQNLSIEALGSLYNISKKYSSIKVKKADQEQIETDLEPSFKMNLYDHYNNNNEILLYRYDPQLCILITTNPRYENYQLNLKLRQRFFKGDLKCIILGSLINLNFPVMFAGSSYKTLKKLVEGKTIINHKLIWSSHYPIIIYNKSFLKRHDNKILNILKYFKNSRKALYLLPDGIWNKTHLLNPSLYDVGTNYLTQMEPVNNIDFEKCSSLYFINVGIAHKFTEFKKLANLKLISSIESFFLNSKKIGKTFIEQNHRYTDYRSKLNLKSQHTPFTHLFFPSSNFYENDESFFDFQGTIKTVSQIVKNSESRNHWQILRQLERELTKIDYFKTKDNKLINIQYKNLQSYKQYFSFNNIAMSELSSDLELYYKTTTNSFNFVIKAEQFKPKTTKLILTKIKYWLDDFYIGGKDDYSENSLVMSKCSNSKRNKVDNFF